MERWLNDLLCLDAAEHTPPPPARLPHPGVCPLSLGVAVNRLGARAAGPPAAPRWQLESYHWEGSADCQSASPRAVTHYCGSRLVSRLLT